MPGLFHGTSLERPVTCEKCAKPLAECRCPRDKSGALLLPKDQKVRVRREKRRGKPVTVVAGLDAHANDLDAMLEKLKSSLGCGGTLAQAAEGASELELQGDHRDKVIAWLSAQGFAPKAAGG